MSEAAQQADEADEGLALARLVHGGLVALGQGAPAAPRPSQLIPGVLRTSGKGLA
jgi:hypothetical protein